MECLIDFNMEKDFITITNKDIYDELKDHKEIQKEILAHAKITNGRVTKLEARSLGMWIAAHPFKFTGFVLVFVSVVISDVRQPVLDLVGKFFV